MKRTVLTHSLEVRQTVRNRELEIFIDVFSYFDFLAPIYDRIIGRLLGPPDLELWTELLKLPVDGRLLDAGGGTGRVSAQLRPLVRQLVLVDVSFGMLRRAREKGEIDPLQADVALLPFPEASFERIMVTDALHHFPRQRMAIRELVRVLAQGGVLVIEEFDIRRLPVKILALFEKLILMGSCFPQPGEIRSLILEEGLPAEIREGEGFSVMIVAKK